MGTAIPIAVAQATSGAVASAGAGAAAAAGTAAASAAYASAIVTATHVGLALGYAAQAYLINAAATALTGKEPKQKGAGIDLNYSGTFEPRRIIYGEARVGGMQTIPPIATGSDGKMLHLVLTLAGHECESITDVWFDDTKIESANISAVTGASTDGKVTDGKYKGHAWLRRYLGTSTQTLDYILGQADPTVFTADFRGRGIAYLAAQLWYDGTLGGVYKSGVPNITALIRGKKCYDPRTATTIWTDNPAIILRDYLVTEVGFASSQIDDTLIIAAANVCDQTVAIPTATTQKRYRCNVVLSADADWEENIEQIVDTMRGRIVFRDGQWRVYAGAWEVPSVSITQADWIGPTRVQASAPMEDRWNAVRVWYVDKTRNYQRVECFQRRNTTYETEDGGERIWKELEIAGCDNEYEAQRHGELCLRSSRNQLKIVGALRPEFIKLSTWEPVSVTDSDYGWDAKTFRVFSMEMTPEGPVEVVLVEEGSALWTDLAEGDYNTITTAPTVDPGASLPSARTSFVAAPQAGSIEFSWDVTSDEMPGEQTRIVEYTSSGYAHLGTELWRGVGTRVNIPKTDVTTRYYWIQGAVGSYLGVYTPNTFGYPMAANSGGGAGSMGSPGLDAVMVGLTLPAVTLPASVDGNVADYSAAAGFLQVFKGGVDVTTYAATRASSQAGVTGTVNSAHGLPWAANSKGAYRVTACTSDIGVLWTEAVYSGTTYLRPFVVSKARVGSAGLNAPVLSLRSTGQTFSYSGSGTVIGVNTIGFDADLLNLSGTIGIYANNFRADGTLISSYALSGTGNSNRGLHVSSFTQAGTTAYATVVASLSGGYTDRITVVRVQQGANGTDGSSGSPGLSAHGLLLNGGFESGTSSGWSTSAPTSIVNSAAGAWGGNYFARLAEGAGGPNCISDKVAVQPGEVYRLSVYARPDYVAPATAAAGLYCRAYLADKSTSAGQFLIRQADPASVAWQPLWGEYTIPSSVRFIALDFGESGGTGYWILDDAYLAQRGNDALIGYLTNEAHTLPASSNGYVPSYAGADGRMVLMSGVNSVNVNSITFAVNSNPQNITMAFSTNGTYLASGGLDLGEDSAVVWLRGTYAGAAVDKGFTLAKSMQGPQGPTGSTGATGPTGVTGAAGLTIYSEPPAKSVACTAGGVPLSGQLPYPVQFSVWAGANHVTSYCTWSHVASGCTVINSNNGLYSITALAEDYGTLRASAVYSGTTTVGASTFAKARAGYASATAQDGTLTVSNSVGFNTDSGYYCGGPLFIAVGPGGSISLDVNHLVGTGALTKSVLGAVWYRTTSGTGAFTQIGASEIYTTLAGDFAGGEDVPITFTRSMAAPSVPGVYEFIYTNARSGGTITTKSPDDFTVQWSGT